MNDNNKENGIELTLEAVRKFLTANNGKVKHVDIASHFRTVLITPEAREDFRNILQLITATITENGDKYVVLINNTHDKFQNSVIMRKASRPLSVRKEIARSRHECNNMMVPFAAYRGNVSDDDDRYSTSSSMSASSQESIGVTVETGLVSGSSSTDRKDDDNKSASNESIDKCSQENYDELYDDNLEMGVEILPEEKEWFIASSTGNKCVLEKLLADHPKLSQNRDFILGYTALHWAAKLGRADIVKLIIKNGVDVHCKSHGGYTALHVAAMSGKDQVITQLIELHSASIHKRDHSGKKPKDLVKETVAADVQRKLGRTVIRAPDWVLSDQRRASEARRGSFMLQYRKE